MQYRKHSTAQHNQPAQNRKASTCRSKCDNASKQTEWATVSTCRRAFTQHAFSNRRGNRICPAYKNLQVLAQRWCFARRIYLSLVAISTRYKVLFLSVFFLCISYMHATSGLLSWIMELLAFASREFAPKMVDHSVCFFIRVCHSLR